MIVPVNKMGANSSCHFAKNPFIILSQHIAFVNEKPPLSLPEADYPPRG